MALTYDWVLLGYKKYNFDELHDVIVHADWKVIGTDENGDKAEYKSSVIWDPNNITPANFLPHDQVSKEMVLEWVKNLVETQPERQIEQKIRTSIAAKKVKPL